MSWATVAGLALICVAACAVAAWIAAIYREHKRKVLDNDIAEAEQALAEAIEAQPDNFTEHLRLRTVLRGLREQREALG